MKQRINKWLSLLLVFVMMISMLAACAGKETDVKESTAEPAEEKTEAAETTDAEVENEEKDWGEPVNLQLYCYTQAEVPQWFNDYLAEEIGVTVEYLQASDEKTAAMVASGEFAEIGAFDTGNGFDLAPAIRTGGLLDLTDYLDQLPNVTKNAPELIEAAKILKSDETGGIYGIPLGLGQAQVYPVDIGNVAIKVRWDIYEKAGFPEVKDTQSLLECLKKMQDVYPETEEGVKTYAFNLFNDWDGLYVWATNAFMTMYGVSNTVYGYTLYNVKEQKTEPMLAKDSPYIQALKTYFDANQMGILNPDSLTMTYDEASATYANFSALAAMSGCAGIDYKGLYGENGTTPKGYTSLCWDGQTPVVESKVYGTHLISISADLDDEKRDACLRLINLMFDYEGFLTMKNGPKGFLWDIEDGKPVATQYYLDNFMSGAEYVFEDGTVYEDAGIFVGLPASFQAGHEMKDFDNLQTSMSVWEGPLKVSLEDNVLMDAWKKQYEGYDNVTSYYVENDLLLSKPASLRLVEQCPDNIQLLIDSIKIGVVEKSWKMIYAENEAEFWSIYEEMYNEAEELGLQDVVDWATGAYARADETLAQIESVNK